MALTVVVRATGADGSLGEPQTLTFEQSRLVLGRGAHADVRLPSRAVSETHAVVRVELSELSVTDEGSTNGTAVNGVRVVHGRKKALRSGDRLSLPGFELTLEWSTASADPAGRTGTIARRLLRGVTGEAESMAPSLELRTGRKPGRRWELSQLGVVYVAGRGEHCDVVLDDHDSSREHAQFVRDVEGVIVRDMASKNGVVVGGRACAERRLRDGDSIQLGRSVLLFADPSDALLRAFEGGADESLGWDPARQSAPPPAPEPPAPLPEPEPAPEPVAIAPAVASPKAPVPALTPAKRGGAGAFDGVVVLFSAVILLVSVAALYMLLRGGGGSVPR